eukprot:5670544-Pyramimonas_sp.AAC.1
MQRWRRSQGISRRAWHWSNLSAAGRRLCIAQGLASKNVVLQIASSRARAASLLQPRPRCLCAAASSSF